MKMRKRRRDCLFGALREHQRLPARGSASSEICAAQPRPVSHHTALHCSIPYRMAPSHTSLPCPEPYHADRPPLPCSTPHCFTPHHVPIHVALPHTTLFCTTRCPQPHISQSHSTSPPNPVLVPPHAASPCTLFPSAPDITLSPRDKLGRGAGRPDGEQHSRQGQRPVAWPDLPAPSAACCSPSVSPALPASV